jgi:hypothetical protein
MYNFHTCNYTMCSHSHYPWSTSFVISFQLWSLFVQLVGHYVATIMPLVVTYVPLWSYSIGIVLWLDGSYGAITWPLIKYYQFTIHIMCEFVDLKLDPNVTYTIFQIFILEAHKDIQTYTPNFFLGYMSKCRIDNSWFFGK